MSANHFIYAMLTHRGRVRKGNEDTCAAAPEAGAYVVCDGMGGAAAGEIASNLAADTFLAQSGTCATRRRGRKASGSVECRDPGGEPGGVPAVTAVGAVFGDGDDARGAAACADPEWDKWYMEDGVARRTTPTRG